MGQYYIHYEGLLCPYSYSTCKRYIENCIVPKNPDFNTFKNMHNLAERCIYLGVSLNEAEYRTREVPVKKFPNLSVDKNKMIFR